MLHEGILARMGRLLAAIASETIDNAESSNKVALVKQAIREIDAGADEARHALGKSRAEEFRLKRLREELDTEAANLNDKIRLAIAENREDLARAGVARQIDLESQGIALERAMDFIELEIDEQTKALQAMLGARREAEVRFQNVIAQHLVETQPLVLAVAGADQKLLRGIDVPLQLGLEPIRRRNGNASPAFQGLVGQEIHGLGR